MSARSVVHASFTITRQWKASPSRVFAAFADENKKKLWFGGGSTDVTDVYTPSVHVSLGSWPHPTLR